MKPYAMTPFGRFLTGLVLALLWLPRLVLAQGPTPWSVETPTGATRSLAFTATEGTWTSLSIAPDGRSMVSVRHVMTNQHGTTMARGIAEIELPKE